MNLLKTIILGYFCLAGSVFAQTANCYFGQTADQDLRGIRRSVGAVKLYRFKGDPEKIVLKFGFQGATRDQAYAKCVKVLAAHVCRAEFTPGTSALRDEHGIYAPEVPNAYASLYSIGVDSKGNQTERKIAAYRETAECEIGRMTRARDSIQAESDRALAAQWVQDIKASEYADRDIIGHLDH
jgi:hypothetical protein